MLFKMILKKTEMIRSKERSRFVREGYNELFYTKPYATTV